MVRQGRLQFTRQLIGHPGFKLWTSLVQEDCICPKSTDGTPPNVGAFALLRLACLELGTGTPIAPACHGQLSIG